MERKNKAFLCKISNNSIFFKKFSFNSSMFRNLLYQTTVLLLNKESLLMIRRNKIVKSCVNSELFFKRFRKNFRNGLKHQFFLVFQALSQTYKPGSYPAIQTSPFFTVAVPELQESL